ncbi:hypothetical protein KPH14_003565 [Odynerus spinipes]|uniref:Uncharacterized protein n=1 Tax=Odynerus spinipes TaxID=1348599 RepID=A0AAD9RDR3_9HYME|nr:hypothetical protein KPH14_003565 [Odynerus spinipes]
MTTVQDSPEKEVRSTSRLKMCQLALTEALEQIRRECQRKYWNASKNESSSSSSSSRQGLLDMELFSVPQYDLSPEHTMKNGVRFCSKQIRSPINTDDPSPWFISNAHNPALYVPLCNTK